MERSVAAALTGGCITPASSTSVLLQLTRVASFGAVGANTTVEETHHYHVKMGIKIKPTIV